MDNLGKITPAKPKVSIKNIIDQPLEMWKDNLKNDFEIPVFEYYLEIKKIKETLYENGALYASMSGSGSSVFGIFTKEQELTFLRDEKYFYKVINFHSSS